MIIIAIMGIIIIIMKRLLKRPFPLRGYSKRFTMTDHKCEGGGVGNG